MASPKQLSLAEPANGAGLSRDSLSTKIYDNLRASLLTGALEPGERLNIRRLAVKYDTSPTPVREAIMQLVREGGLELRPGHELRVPILTTERYLKIRQVRKPLERLAAELAAQFISDDKIGLLAQINQKYLNAENKEHWKEALSLNTQFHFTVYNASGNDLLVRSIENLWMLSGPFLINQYPSAMFPHDETHTHARLIDALRRRSVDEAGEIVVVGLERGSALILDRVAGRQDHDESAGHLDGIHGGSASRKSK